MTLRGAGPPLELLRARWEDGTILATRIVNYENARRLYLYRLVVNEDFLKGTPFFGAVMNSYRIAQISRYYLQRNAAF